MGQRTICVLIILILTNHLSNYSAGTVLHLKNWIDKYHKAAESAGVVVSYYSTELFFYTALITSTAHSFMWQFQRPAGSPYMGVCSGTRKKVLSQNKGASFVCSEHCIGPKRRYHRVDDGASRLWTRGPGKSPAAVVSVPNHGPAKVELDEFLRHAPRLVPRRAVGERSERCAEQSCHPQDVGSVGRRQGLRTKFSI